MPFTELPYLFAGYLKLHGYAVEDPEEADLFYVHAYFYCATSGYFKGTAQLHPNC
jgi:hypothetical protein